MIGVEPVDGTAYKEALDLGPAVVKYPGAPSLMLHAVGIAVFVAVTAVELAESVSILGKVCGHPVHDDTDALLMHAVDEIHEIVRGAVSGGGGEITRDLISPGAVIGELRERHQLDVGVSHLADIFRQLVGEFPVAEHGSVVMPLPGAQMDLIDIHGLVERRRYLSVLPGIVMPLVSRDVIELAGGAGRRLGVHCERIALVQFLSVRGRDQVFI